MVVDTAGGRMGDARHFLFVLRKRSDLDIPMKKESSTISLNQTKGKIMFIYLIALKFQEESNTFMYLESIIYQYAI